MNISSMRTSLIAGSVALFALGLLGCNRGGSEKELIESATKLIDKKDSKGAQIQLKNALQKNPDSAEARLMLGKTLLASGDPVNALVELRKAQELQTPDDRVMPELARAMLLVGEESKVVAQYGETQLKNAAALADLKSTLASAYAVQGNMDQARKAIGDALRATPGYPPAMLVHARITAADGDLDGAIAMLDKVLAQEPGHERAGALKGDILWQAKRDADGALAAYRSVLGVHPDSIAARAAAASILFRQQKIDETRVEFAQLQKAAPNHPETLYLEAQLAFFDKNYKQSREIADRVLKAMPNNARILEIAGASEFRMKGYLQAEALLGKALKLAPKQLLTRSLLAQTYLRSGQPGKAIEVLQPLIDTPQADGASLAMAGEAYLQMGDAKRSDDAFRRALKTAPTDPRVRTSAAMAQMTRGNNSGAIAELESVASTDTDARADLALISARLRQNDNAGALKAIDALEKKLPDQALPHNLRGRVLVLQKDVPGATKSFEAALAKDRNYFPAVASLAALDLTNNKPDAARKRFEDHLAAQPKSYQAKLAIAELDARSGAPAAKVIATLREAVKLEPSEATPHLVLINRLLGLGDGKAALQAAQEASAALPNSIDVMDALGRAQVAGGDSQNAVSTFKRLTSMQPRNAMHEVRLADAYMSLQDRDAAGRALRHAIELQPDLTLARRALASLAIIDKRPQDALVIARELQQRNPKDSSGFVLEGEVEASRKNWEASSAAYRNALQRAKVSDLAVKLHIALTAAKKTAEADKLATDWLKESPKDAAFLYYMGDLALAQGDIVRAESRYRTVLEVQPDNALALNNVAWLMVKQGKPGALAIAEKANGLLPNKAPLVDTLAGALEADNQLPKAIETQKRAVALEPKDPTLVLRLAKLYIKQGDKPRARAELESLTLLGAKFPAQAEVASLLKSL